MKTPLGIIARVPLSGPTLPASPLILGLVCAALAALAATYLVRMPGLYLSLDGRPLALPSKLPAAQAPDLARVGTVATLVSAQGQGVYLLEGRIMQGRAALEVELQRIAKNPARRNLPVLVRADSSQTLGSLAELTESIRQAGFPGILLATDPP